MRPTNAFQNTSPGMHITSQSQDKIVNLACENPMLATGVGCIAGAVALVGLTKGAALPIAGPMIALGTGLISTYFAGKSAAFLATEVAKPVITTVASGLMSLGKAAVNAISSSPPTPTSSRDVLQSAILDYDKVKPSANKDVTETKPSDDYEHENENENENEPPSLS